MESLQENLSPESNELSKLLFHGTITPAIEVMEPRNRYTPSGIDCPPRVYTSPNPVFAAAQGFPWSSDEGIDIYKAEDGVTVLKVPAQHKERLEQPLFLYSLPSDSFELTEDEKTGETFHSEEEVVVHSVERFDSVREAIKQLGGRVEIIES